MLYLDNPVGALHGVMVYRDHANPNLFYYHSDRPRISRTVTGTPEMQLIKYRRDITDNPAFDATQAQSLGGGLFNFTVDIGVDEGVLARVSADLQRRAPGQVSLSPIPFRGGSVRLSTTKEGEAGATSSGFSFFEEVLGASTPTLVGDNRAVFSIVLSQEGATLVEQALRTGLSPVGVVYELNALAMRPAFQVKVTAEYSRVYEHFETEVGIRSRQGRTATAVEIGDAYQKLVENGSIKVEVLEFTDDADLKARSQAALDWFKGEITKEFFQTALQPPSFAGSSAFSELNTLFSALQNGQPAAPSTPPLAATPPPASPAAAPPTGLASGVTTTTQANQAAQTTNAAASTDFTQTALSLRHYRQEELHRREFDFRLQQAVSWNFGAQGMLSTITRGVDVNRSITVVDLDDEFFTRLRVDVSLASDLARLGVAALTVNMEYPGERPDGAPPVHHDGWIFRPGEVDTKQFMCWLNAAKTQIYQYQMEVAFAPDSPWQGTASGVKSPWLTSSARQLTLNPLDGLGVQEVRVVSALGPDTVSQAQVELRYGSESAPLAEIYFVKPGEAPRTWKIRLSDPNERTVRYRVTYTLPGGGAIEGDWTETNDGIVVVPDPFGDRVRVRVFSQLVAAELVEALLVVRYTDAGHGYSLERQLAFSPTALAPQTVEFPVFRGGPRSYAWDLTVVKNTGQVITHAGEASEPALILKE